MTLYTDAHAVRDNVIASAQKTAKRKSRKIWALAAVGTVLAGGAASSSLPR